MGISIFWLSLLFAGISIVGFFGGNILNNNLLINMNLILAFIFTAIASTDLVFFDGDEVDY